MTVRDIFVGGVTGALMSLGLLLLAFWCGATPPTMSDVSIITTLATMIAMHARRGDDAEGA